MLEQLRTITRGVARAATESISYGMPSYRYNGRPLVAFGAFKHHCGLYGSNATFLKSHKDALASYDTAAGTIRFPIGKPLPVSLIKKLLKARLRDRAAG
jgi:uncharacterized protein YdhG (YjbR/CyaY superfamily)